MRQSFVPRDEIDRRIGRLKEKCAAIGSSGVLLFDPVSMFYFAATIQNGVLFVPESGEPVLFVRRNLDRAVQESPLEKIIGFRRFDDIAPFLARERTRKTKIGLNEPAMVLMQYRRLVKYAADIDFYDASGDLSEIRSIKSDYEIAKMRKAAGISVEITSLIPELLVPGITEWELGLKLFHESSLRSRQCLTRLSSPVSEILFGNICFGTSALAPVPFEGPGGVAGKSPACPYLGSDRRLRGGDLVYIDCGYPFDEYYVDKTRIFSIGEPEEEVLEKHRLCLDIQERTRRQLVPGKKVSDIYSDIMEKVVIPAGCEDVFMGYGSNRVTFLGHGIGMAIDEYPVINGKSDAVLAEHMMIAVEPKIAVPDRGMVGIENTFLVTRGGGENLTADNDDIVVVEH
ncbi:MAG: aminopeptidase P family protein [Spirochaetales bacterium]|nr:aminopeptidase P family protein [Spirochaetales bacterium]